MSYVRCTYVKLRSTLQCRNDNKNRHEIRFFRIGASFLIMQFIDHCCNRLTVKIMLQSRLDKSETKLIYRTFS